MKLNREEAFTGLEAAIVLIAFVVVAAVFSYVVLGAGFFTTQKAQEVVYTSVDQASSSIEILGDVYGLNDTTTTPIDFIETVRFTVGLTAGGSEVDFSQTTVTYSDADTVERLTREGNGEVAIADIDAGEWGVIRIANAEAGTDDLLLENQEQFTIVVNPTADIAPNQEFQIQIRPAVGTAYAIIRSAPARIQGVNALY